MAFQLGIPLGNPSLSEILLAAIPVGLTILISWWVYKIKKRRERVYDWHREMQDIFSSVISVGRRLKMKERTGVDLGKVEELIPEASKLDAQVNTPPSGVEKMVDDQVFGDVKKAAGLAYHLVHLPAPEKYADSIAGVMRHQYEMLQVLDRDTDVEMRKALDVIGEIAQPEDIDITEEEAEQILSEFEDAADRRVEEAEEMTVDELMQLPWEEVDRVVSPSVRQELVQFSVDQYYDKALLEIPRQARKALADSEEAIFE
jgi:hypothetical protein